uniref:Protein quiver n=1 Tax=Macrostomum lignano TaxID=282301 RepID=A0A1I8GRN5_9PLAT
METEHCTQPGAFNCQFLLLLLGSLIPLATGDEADFSDHITCYECEGQLGNSTCSTPGVDIDKVLNQVSCVRGGCLKWAYYKNSQLQLVRTCSLRVNMSIYLHSACRQERERQRVHLHLSQ